MKTVINVIFVFVLLTRATFMNRAATFLTPTEAKSIVFNVMGKHEIMIRHRRFIADRGISANLHALLFFTGYRTGIRVNNWYDRVFGNEGAMERKKVMAEIKALEKNSTRIQDELESLTLAHLEEILELQKNITLMREAHRQDIIEILDLMKDDSEVLVVDEGCFEDLQDRNEEDPACDILTILFW